MKTKLYFLILVSTVMLASCTKWLPNGQQNIVGSWKLESVQRQTSYGTEPIYTGYENGSFYFDNNGNAQYSDNYGQMNGTWRMVSHPSDGTNSLELRIYDYHNSDAIEWEFYSTSVSSSRIVGYMNRYGYEYRYEFRRY